MLREIEYKGGGELSVPLTSAARRKDEGGGESLAIGLRRGQRARRQRVLFSPPPSQRRAQSQATAAVRRSPRLAIAASQPAPSRSGADALFTPVANNNATVLASPEENAPVQVQIEVAT